MTTKQVSIIFACLGILSLALHREWIIIRWPYFSAEQSNQQGAEKKTAKLYYWRHDRWVQEGVEVIWVEHDTAQTAKYLIDRWLTWLDEERIVDKKVSLQTVMLTPNGQEIWLSFDRSPLPLNASTYEQWHWIESLLKTIRENGIKVQRVHFLVHHQELQDYRLDFGNSWPVIGFH